MATWNMNNSRKVGACWLFFNEVLARPSSCPVCVSSSNLTHTSGCRDDVPLLHSKHETNPITHCYILFSLLSFHFCLCFSLFCWFKLDQSCITSPLRVHFHISMVTFLWKSPRNASRSQLISKSSKVSQSINIEISIGTIIDRHRY